MTYRRAIPLFVLLLACGSDPADVAGAVELLLKAEKPLIYAGEGVIYAGASAELKEFAELANTPVISTLKAKGAFPEDHPLFVGVRGDVPAWVP